MAARARTFTDGGHGHQARSAAPRAKKLQAATADHAAAPSPALAMQQALATEVFLGEAPASLEWRRIAAAAFIAVACGAFWAAVALGVSRLF